METRLVQGRNRCTAFRCAFITPINRISTTKSGATASLLPPSPSTPIGKLALINPNNPHNSPSPPGPRVSRSLKYSYETRGAAALRSSAPKGHQITPAPGAAGLTRPAGGRPFFGEGGGGEEPTHVKKKAAGFGFPPPGLHRQQGPLRGHV